MTRITIDTRIAKILGIKSALILAYIQDLYNNHVDRNINYEDGHHWIKKSIKSFSEDLGFYSEFTISTALDHLVERKIILIRKPDIELTIKRSGIPNWYTLNHEVIGKLLKPRSKSIQKPIE